MKYNFPIIKTTILGVGLSLFVTSCKKLIGTPPNIPSQISQKQVFADSADVASAIAGVYNSFNVTYGLLSFFNGQIPMYTGLCGDELIENSSNSPADLELLNDLITVTNQDILNMWNPPYSALYQVNVCLENIPNAGISQSAKQQYMGELKVVRALYYFHLVNLFGAVPLITSSDYKVNANMPRTPVDSVYGQIIADLKDARQLLTAAYPTTDKARPNLYTADALLAKAYLYRKQWPEAEAMATEIIGSGQYSLVGDLNKVFLGGSSEAIWQLPTNGILYQTTEAGSFVPYNNGLTVPPVIFTASQIATYQPGDQRMGTWVGRDTVNGTVYYYPWKYKNLKNPAPTQEGYIICRLGEQYLIRSEARAQQSNLSGAAQDCNIVHQRAGLPAIAAANTTDLLDSLVTERRVELSCEWGNRWYDLKRWGVIDAVLGAEKPVWNPYTALWPVPFSETLLNTFLTQNPGY